MVMKTLKRLAACLTAAITLTATPALADGDDDLRTALRIAIEAGVFGDDVRSAVRSNQRNWGWQNTRFGEGLVIYSDPQYRGRALQVNGYVGTLKDFQFNDIASSVRVFSGTWELCADPDLRGRCEIISRDQPSISYLGLNDRLTSIRRVDGRGGSNRDYRDDRYRNSSGSGGLTLFTDPNFRGRQLTVDGYVGTLKDFGFNDTVSSVRVNFGTWQLCADPDLRGRCEIISRDQSSISRFGLNDRLTSIRRVDDRDFGYRNGGYDDGRNDRLFGGRNDDYRYGNNRGFGFATVFTGPNCQGRSLNVSEPISRLRDFGFNDNISSIDIRQGAFEVCTDPNFRGRCRVISRDIDVLRDVGLNDTISSIRPVDDGQYYDDGGRRLYPY